MQLILKFYGTFLSLTIFTTHFNQTSTFNAITIKVLTKVSKKIVTERLQKSSHLTMISLFWKFLALTLTIDNVTEDDVFLRRPFMGN